MQEQKTHIPFSGCIGSCSFCGKDMYDHDSKMCDCGQAVHEGCEIPCGSDNCEQEGCKKCMLYDFEADEYFCDSSNTGDVKKSECYQEYVNNE